MARRENDAEQPEVTGAAVGTKGAKGGAEVRCTRCMGVLTCSRCQPPHWVVSAPIGSYLQLSRERCSEIVTADANPEVFNSEHYVASQCRNGRMLGYDKCWDHLHQSTQISLANSNKGTRGQNPGKGRRRGNSRGRGGK